MEVVLLVISIAVGLVIALFAKRERRPQLGQPKFGLPQPALPRLAVAIIATLTIPLCLICLGLWLTWETKQGLLFVILLILYFIAAPIVLILMFLGALSDRWLNRSKSIDRGGGHDDRQMPAGGARPARRLEKTDDGADGEAL